MSIEYLGLSEINGPLIALEGIRDASYDEIVELSVEGKKKIGRIIEVYEDKAVIQVFQGTEDMSLNNTHTKLTGHPMELSLSEDILGRIFNGVGQPIDGLGNIISELKRDVNGQPLNPCAREYPRNYIKTGISAIDCLTTLIRGQKLPIFSGNGLPHDQLAAQIVRQASLGGSSDEEFAIVFAAMGVKHDVADFFRRTFEESGASSHVVMYLNLANDPVIERLITPRVALTAAEYLAFEKGKHILVILTDVTSFAEAMREVSSSKGEIPSRKGYPGYLYSELATLYERAGIVRGSKGSVTQIPILTMPNDDITHPIPDLTGYITEGQIVLDRTLHQKAVYPPISILPSLSRLMKDGIGQGYTREDHQDLANQLFSSYARVGEARNLASVIGEDELSPVDKKYLKFGADLEQEFIAQSRDEDRSILDTLNKGWKLLSILPREELDRVDTKILDQYYHLSAEVLSENE
ncbi:V-type ATP synthase subunit B [Anaerocolumna sedimenticola]|uniref:V-type ATP synthase beta chain n=1 Tax=Anaerocolumna sedimenticola TaxID=2696063 RepID=A0A6P1TGN0_9FIRM|nr:V-type ATP synthase subunit B [Anaerocolumna sedimenticola]QHQ60304.1 V-type ATP synthase subunit B [Anaerocolumna sedimenticola]